MSSPKRLIPFLKYDLSPLRPEEVFLVSPGFLNDWTAWMRGTLPIVLLLLTRLGSSSATRSILDDALHRLRLPERQLSHPNAPPPTQPSLQRTSMAIAPLLLIEKIGWRNAKL